MVFGALAGPARRPSRGGALPTDDALLELQERLGYRFKEPELLLRALSHRSWVEERAPGGRAPAHLSQQRLEFLGDALLGYVVGRWLFERLPLAGEGELTNRRSEFTKDKWLAAKGASLGLDRFVLVGRGEAQNHANRRLPEDTVEAIIGAVLLDGGDDAAVRLIRSWLPPEPPPPGPPDPIIEFKEWYQGRFRRPPPEPSHSSSGPDNARTWCARLDFDGVVFEGTGRKKQDAERALYAKVLASLPPGA